MVVAEEIDRGRQARPFVIWTLQRTGGTNLTGQLAQRSGLKPREHEPFNKRRELGDITRRWIENEDQEQLLAAMDEVCAAKRPIKHCVEQVPWEISWALATRSSAAGYGHLFLYRKDPLSRLLSVEYARRTGVWGPRHLEKAEHDDAAFRKPLDVPRLIEHEKRCNWLLSAAWHVLQGEGANPVALAYEDAYVALAYEDAYADDAGAASEALVAVLRALDLSRGRSADRKLVDAVRARGNQGTRERYSRFEGRDELARQLATINTFIVDAQHDAVP